MGGDTPVKLHLYQLPVGSGKGTYGTVQFVIGNIPRLVERRTFCRNRRVIPYDIGNTGKGMLPILAPGTVIKTIAKHTY